MPIALKDQLRPYPVTSGTLRHSSGSFELFFITETWTMATLRRKTKTKMHSPVCQNLDRRSNDQNSPTGNSCRIAEDNASSFLCALSSPPKYFSP
ncbi:hypothetical protein Peur_073186 [Populus x canadensis]|jgi:hypothetical protein